jgi:amidase
VVEWNRAHPEVELAHFGQALFEMALEGPTVTDAAYLEARARCVAASRTDGIDAVLAEHALDALVTPSMAPACPIDLVNPEAHPGSCTSASAMAGYPILTVPTELVSGLPVAVSIWGGAHAERDLLRIGHAFEQARDRGTGPLPPPGFPDFV